MYAILYDPDDRDLVAACEGWLLHATHCPGCMARVQTDDGKATLARVLTALSRIGSKPLADLNDALELCEVWRGLDATMTLLDQLTGGPSNGQAQH